MAGRCENDSVLSVVHGNAALTNACVALIVRLRCSDVATMETSITHSRRDRWLLFLDKSVLKMTACAKNIHSRNFFALEASLSL